MNYLECFVGQETQFGKSFKQNRGTHWDFRPISKTAFLSSYFETNYSLESSLFFLIFSQSLWFEVKHSGLEHLSCCLRHGGLIAYHNFRYIYPNCVCYFVLESRTCFYGGLAIEILLKKHSKQFSCIKNCKYNGYNGCKKLDMPK